MGTQTDSARDNFSKFSTHSHPHDNERNVEKTKATELCTVGNFQSRARSQGGGPYRSRQPRRPRAGEALGPPQHPKHLNPAPAGVPPAVVRGRGARAPLTASSALSRSQPRPPHRARCRRFASQEAASARARAGRGGELPAQRQVGGGRLIPAGTAPPRDRGAALEGAGVETGYNKSLVVARQTPNSQKALGTCLNSTTQPSPGGV